MGCGRSGTLRDQSLAPFFSQGGIKKIFFGILSSQPCRTLSLPPTPPAEGVVICAIPGLGPPELHFPNSGTGSPKASVVFAMLHAPL